MDRLLLLPLVVIAALGLAHLSSAYDFYVGGEKGWVEKPDKSYDLWAQSMRFQVHDKLVFRYKKGDDSVLVVNKVDFNTCNTTNPIKKFGDGNTTFSLDRSGPFYFISGESGHCAQGQKLVVVVLAERNNPALPPTAYPPSPSQPPSPTNPSSPVVSEAPSPSQVTAFTLLGSGALALFLVPAVVR